MKLANPPTKICSATPYPGMAMARGRSTEEVEAEVEVDLEVREAKRALRLWARPDLRLRVRTLRAEEEAADAAEGGRTTDARAPAARPAPTDQAPLSSPDFIVADTTWSEEIEEVFCSAEDMTCKDANN